MFLFIRKQEVTKNPRYIFNKMLLLKNSKVTQNQDQPGLSRAYNCYKNIG